MKCPYCGAESRNQVCDKCKAPIPVPEPKEEDPKEEPIRFTKKKTRSD